MSNNFQIWYRAYFSNLSSSSSSSSISEVEVEKESKTSVWIVSRNLFDDGFTSKAVKRETSSEAFFPSIKKALDWLDPKIKKRKNELNLQLEEISKGPVFCSLKPHKILDKKILDSLI